MILLIGGAGETGVLANALVSAGFFVLVSTATDAPLSLGSHPNLSRRSGPLDRESLSRLILEREITVLIDASHPYASVITNHARKVAKEHRIPYFRWYRPAALHDSDEVIWAQDHADAARIAFSFGQPVLLTTGSRNLKPYAEESRRTGTSVVVRVLDRPDSLEACLQAGIPPNNVIAATGPFSLEQNVTTIREFGIGVIVTKDSGTIGGVPEKIEAARQERCRVVVIRRPDEESSASYSDLTELLQAVNQLTKSFS
ncbi:precorrin-6A reductase [Desulfomonile tiedjei]|uniref:Precorrin-6A reductase n=1 Tax=Desulfomonile tiedjei (strain ATCC 49306 / DSM 6799 / DCB-1) TaxID=706587 RepID=I4CF45_DESTA|nr:precorrin-6A reductase [Desulfomonile tiedjei]AFM28186.1 precorrin-6A reductase [Desulfomonile tiedjei DSM 6799]